MRAWKSSHRLIAIVDDGPHVTQETSSTGLADQHDQRLTVQRYTAVTLFAYSGLERTATRQ